jgi:iron-sulfur cluster assembly protein
LPGFPAPPGFPYSAASTSLFSIRDTGQSFIERRSRRRPATEKEAAQVLAITENAAEAIQAIVASSPKAPGEAGLRIAARPGEEQEKLELTIAAIPAEDDEVVDEHGAHVFLDPGAASYLEDKVLDARVEGQQVGFEVLEQD